MERNHDDDAVREQPERDEELGRLLKRWDAPPPSRGLHDRVLQSYRDRMRPPWWKRLLVGSIPVPASVCAAAALVFVVLTGLILRMPGSITLRTDAPRTAQAPRIIEVPVIREITVERPVEKKVRVPAEGKRRPSPPPSTERSDTALDVTPSPAPPVDSGNDAARELTAADVEFRLVDPAVSVNGAAVECGGSGTVAGAMVRFSIAGRGRFVCSLVPRAGTEFEKAGDVSGRTLSIRFNGMDLICRSQADIVPANGRFQVWVRRDADAVGSSDRPCLVEAVRPVGDLDSPSLK